MKEKKIYTIGEVSEILNLSRDMLRYYEKCGVLHSQRNEQSNYRTYSAMDIFWLLEAMQHKNWGIKIKEISRIRSENYTEEAAKFLHAYGQHVCNDINYNTVLLERIISIEERFRLSALNMGNYWIKKIQAHYVCPLVTSDGDHYGPIDILPVYSHLLCNDRIIPFVDNGCIWNENMQSWKLSIDETYVKRLGIDLPSEMEYIPDTDCICTNTDIGGIDAFDKQADQGIRDYGKKYGISETRPVGMIFLGRGVEQGKFRRFVEMRLSLKE